MAVLLPPRFKSRFPGSRTGTPAARRKRLEGRQGQRNWTPKEDDKIVDGDGGARFRFDAGMARESNFLTGGARMSSVI